MIFAGVIGPDLINLQQASNAEIATKILSLYCLIPFLRFATEDGWKDPYVRTRLDIPSVNLNDLDHSRHDSKLHLDPSTSALEALLFT